MSMFAGVGLLSVSCISASLTASVGAAARGRVSVRDQLTKVLDNVSTIKEAQEKDDTLVILVTEKGSVYKNKPKKTEGYIRSVDVPDPAPTDFRHGIAYNINAGPESISTDIWKDGKCALDGTLDCLYRMREKDGKVVAFTNEKNEDLIEKVADDIYNGKMVGEEMRKLMDQFRLTDDGELQWKNPRCSESERMASIDAGNKKCIPSNTSWEKFTVKNSRKASNLGPLTFFIVILLLFKRDGLPKPKFEINIDSNHVPSFESAIHAAPRGPRPT